MENRRDESFRPQKGQRPDQESPKKDIKKNLLGYSLQPY